MGTAALAWVRRLVQRRPCGSFKHYTRKLATADAAAEGAVLVTAADCAKRLRAGVRRRSLSAYRGAQALRTTSREVDPVSATATALWPPAAPTSQHEARHPQADMWALSTRATVFIALWYTSSLTTLFLNKHILSTLHVDAQTLAMAQMFTTCGLGAVKVHVARVGLGAASSSAALPVPAGASIASSGGVVGWFWRQVSMLPATFVRDMSVVGVLRFLTLMAGLTSIAFVPVSFTETVKSTAPLFTVGVAALVLKEHTSTAVKLSLIPVVCGLGLASATELSFNMIGFAAALINNLLDCVQNVFCKHLMTGKYSYVELQYYTSASALLLQVPLWVGMRSFSTVFGGPAAGTAHGSPAGTGGTGADAASHVNGGELTESGMGAGGASGAADIMWPFGSVAMCLVLDGISYHLQSVFAYGLMGEISPVSHSVANTVKRALLIWLSVLFFGNPVSNMSFLGSAMVVIGVFLYNRARSEQEAVKRAAALVEAGKATLPPVVPHNGVGGGKVKRSFSDDEV